MGLTLSDYSAVLKEVYRGPIRDLLNQSTILLMHIKEGPKYRFRGNNVHIPLHTGRNVGIGPRAENAALPAAGNQAHAEAQYDLRYLYARIRLTGPVMAGSEGDIAAFADALNVEQGGALKDAVKDLNRQLWHDGSGRLTNCGVTTATVTVNVESTKYIQVGDIIDVRDIDAGTPTVASGVTVLTVPSATTFTVTASITTAATHAVYKNGTRATWGTPCDVWGMEALVTNDDVYGSSNGFTNATGYVGKLARGSTTAWASNEKDGATPGTAEALTFARMDAAWDTADERGAGKQPNIVLTNHAVRRKYAALFASNRRYSNVMRLRGGWTGLEYNGVGVFADVDCTQTAKPDEGETMYFLNLSSFSYYKQKDWDWVEGDSGGILHWVTGYDAFEGVLRSYQQLAIEDPRCNCKLNDITET